MDSSIKSKFRWDTAAWFETFAKIRKKSGDLSRPLCNVYQRRIAEVIRFAHETGRPCRMVGLKPRQKGSSTYGVAEGYRRCQAKPCSGLIAGGAHFQGANLFKILRTYAETDELSPATCKVMDMEARFANGSTMERLTLANANAGRSGTYQFLLITEVAYLSEEGVANAEEVLNGLLKCVPYEPDTIIFEESTAKGATGYFYDKFTTAITFDEFKAGKNGVVKLFAAWHEFEDSRLDPAGEGIHSEADLSDHEAELAAQWGLDLWQIAWMRWALREECKGDWDRFLQDYPFDPETAFLKSGRGVFQQSAIQYQESLLPLRPREFGYLQYNERADRVNWTRCDERQARCVRWEQPIPGCRYLVSVDTMTGADQTGGDDPDSHAVFGLRDGYLKHGEWHEPAVVMRNMMVPGSKPGSLSCWWGIDVLEEEVWRMARYYQAIICPEMNMDRGLVELLKLRGDVDIYRREIFNQRENETTNALGWMTTVKTRPRIVEGLASRLRESGRGVIGGGFEVRCPWAIKQMKNFVTKANGRMEASAGHHDDDVLGICIGLQLLDMATPWRETERETWVPRDLRGRLERKVGRNQTFS